MRRLRRKHAEPSEATESQTTPPPQERVELDDQDFPKDPYEFVASQEAHLENSSELWRRVAEGVSNLQDLLEGPVEEGLRKFYQQEGVHENTLERSVKKISSELAVYALLAARVASAKGFDSAEDAAGYLARASLGIRSGVLDYIISEETVFNSYVKAQFNIMLDMREADEIAENTLMNLMRCACRNHPDLIDQLQEVYKQGIDKTDSRFKELRKMVELNWRSTAGSQFSVLREYPRYLEAHPELFRDDFTDIVVEQEKDKKYRVVRAMTRFAIAASGDEVTAETMREMLKKTYDSWQNFDDIKTIFKSFVSKQVEDTTTKLGSIAGPAQPKSIRSHHAEEEMRRMAEYLSVNVLGRPNNRRKRDRAAAKKMGSASLPTMQEVTAAADEQERVSVVRKIMRVRQDENGVELLETSLEEMVASFSNGNTNGLKQDIEKIISFLKENPINPACSRIRSRNGSIMIDGKPHNLWRFAPNRCQGLSVHPDNRFLRVVHALVDNNLVIIDLLDHDSFDKKY